jgi:hypothetical protein
MMADNPDMVKMAAEMMAAMPPDQVAAMAAATPGMTPEMARLAAEQMRSMPPDALAAAAKAAASAAGGGGGLGGLGAAGGGPAAAAAAAAAAAGLDASQLDPRMMAEAADMVDRMAPDELRRFMEAAAAANGAALPPDMDPAMVKASMSMLKNMVGGRVFWVVGVCACRWCACVCVHACLCVGRKRVRFLVCGAREVGR